MQAIVNEGEESAATLHTINDVGYMGSFSSVYLESRVERAVNSRG